MDQLKYLEDVYSGFLGMNVGIRLGAPVEPTLWTYERIKHFYGNITSYVKPFKNFAADDDANGPVFFLRSLIDKDPKSDLSAEDVAQAWLNYAREGVGMFWWGGYGTSTEHTAYLNLKNGINAPLSGSIEVNGKIIAEQIGGQIFIDTWGLICPGQPERAAHLAQVAASVSHDGEGLEGARFIAACIAEAFVNKDLDSVIAKALSLINPNSIYHEVCQAVIDFHKNNPGDFEPCLRFLQQNYGYDKYRGVCHIIPNAGVCIMSLLYGRTFARSIEIATMAGWDTDCNAGNVGTIMGVFDGLSSIADHYRAPIRDALVLSGISGYLNILDIPTYCKEVAALGLSLMGIKPSFNLPKQGELDFDFSLSGSTHGFRTDNDQLIKIGHSNDGGKDGKPALEVLFDRGVRGQSAAIFYKPFYRRSDFDDERYMPVFSPLAYPGQTVKLSVRVDRYNGEGIILSPYVRESDTKKRLILSSTIYKDDLWHDLEFTIPQTGSQIDEIGLIFEPNSPSKFKDFGALYINNFSVSGKADYTIDLSRSSKEFASITPFSHNHGSWSLEEGKMQAMCLEDCEAFTGNYYLSNTTVTGSAVIHYGHSALLGLRVQGAQRGYYAGLDDGNLVIYKNEKGQMQKLVSKPISFELNKQYDFKFTVVDNLLTFECENNKLCVEDSYLSYGMVSYKILGCARVSFGNLSIKEL